MSNMVISYTLTHFQIELSWLEIILQIKQEHNANPMEMIALKMIIYFLHTCNITYKRLHICV